MRIDLRIDRLVLDQAVLGRERAPEVRAALVREMSRLLTAPGAAETLRSIGSVPRLPSADLPPGRRVPLGVRIARAVGRELGVARGAEPGPGRMRRDAQRRGRAAP